MPVVGALTLAASTRPLRGQRPCRYNEGPQTAQPRPLQMFTRRVPSIASLPGLSVLLASLAAGLVGVAWFEAWKIRTHQRGQTRSQDVRPC